MEKEELKKWIQREFNPIAFLVKEPNKGKDYLVKAAGKCATLIILSIFL